MVKTGWLGLLGLLAADLMASPGFNMPRGVTPISYKIYDLHMLIFYICVVIGILTFAVMFYSLYYHRKSRGVVPSKDTGSFTLEVLWTVIPLIILMLMVYPAAKLLLEMEAHQEAKVNILVSGLQWKWKYEYLDHGFSFYSNLSTPPAQRLGTEPKGPHYLLEVDEPVVVPINQKIRFLFTSVDVNHSWWVPELGIKMDTIPGYINEAWAIIEKPGTYRGQCTELCGMLHGYMPIVVEAKSEEDYSKWLSERMAKAQKKSPPKTLTMESAMSLGKKVYETHCQACHQADGQGMPPAIPGMVGSAITVGPLAGHIDVLLNGIKGTGMQAFADQLDDEEIAAVITYERQSWGNDDKQRHGDQAGGLLQPHLIQRARSGQPITVGEEPAEPTPVVAENSLEATMVLGQRIYERNCLACHQADGRGMPPTIASMVGSAITVGSVAGHIDVLLKGIKGTAMQAFAGQLSDEEIAAVVTYERQSWGNDDQDKHGPDAGGWVKPEQVSQRRVGEA